MNKKIKWNQLDQKSTSTLVIILIAVLVYLGVSNFETVKELVYGFLDILSPFLIGFIIAYLLNSPMSFFERTIYKKLPEGKYRRGLAVLSAYLLAIGAVAILVMLVLPSVVDSVKSFISGIDSGITRLDDFVQELLDRRTIPGGEWLDSIVDFALTFYEDIVLMATDALNNMIPKVVDLGIAIGSGFITIITAVVSSVYMLLEKDRLKRQFKQMVYAVLPVKKAHGFLETCRYSNKIFSSFIIGKLIDSAIIGVLCFICCSILGLPLAVLLSVIIGVTNIIPFFGPFIGAVPSIMILLIMEPWGAVKFAILILVLQQFDGNILGPKILGDSTGLSPLMVLIAIIVGGEAFGFAGMLLGVPTFAVIYALVSAWMKRRLYMKGHTVLLDDVSEWEEPPEKSQESEELEESEESSDSE